METTTGDLGLDSHDATPSMLYILCTFETGQFALVLSRDRYAIPK